MASANKTVRVHIALRDIAPVDVDVDSINERSIVFDSKIQKAIIEAQQVLDLESQMRGPQYEFRLLPRREEDRAIVFSAERPEISLVLPTKGEIAAHVTSLTEYKQKAEKITARAQSKITQAQHSQENEEALRAQNLVLQRQIQELTQKNEAAELKLKTLQELCLYDVYYKALEEIKNIWNKIFSTDAISDPIDVCWYLAIS